MAGPPGNSSARASQGPRPASPRTRSLPGTDPETGEPECPAPSPAQTGWGRTSGSIVFRKRGTARSSSRWPHPIENAQLAGVYSKDTGDRILPRRGRTNQPRASPWDHKVKENSSPERAAQGLGNVSPFQGLGIPIRPDPRAMPWADLWLPLRGERQRYRHSCYSLSCRDNLRCSKRSSHTTEPDHDSRATVLSGSRMRSNA